MNIPEQMGFHEASVIRFFRHGAILTLELGDVLVDGKKLQVILTVSPVSAVVIDGMASEAVLMEADDGEVLALEISKNSLSMIVEWNDFSHGKSFTKSYGVLGGEVSVSMA